MKSPFESSNRSSKAVVRYDDRRKRFILRVGRGDNANVKSFAEWDKRISGWVARPTPRVASRILALPNGIDVDPEDGRRLIVLKHQWERRVRAIQDRRSFPSRYPYKTKPREKQKEALDWLYGLDVGALFMDMGTGKTKVAIDLACSWNMDGEITHVVVICPLSVRLNWMENLQTHSPLAFNFFLLGDKKDKDWVTPPPGSVSWIAVGHESLSAGSASKRLAAMLSDVDPRQVLIIVDESHWIKGNNSTRTEVAIELSDRSSRRLILTGSPTPQGPLDYFSQFMFLDPDILVSPGYYQFRAKYAILGGYENKQILGYRDENTLAAAIAPYVFQVKLKDVVDLPEKSYGIIEAEMSKAQAAIYQQMKQSAAVVLEAVGLENKELVCQTILEQYLRLQQITAGFVVEPIVNEETGKATYKPHDISKDTPPKIKLLIQYIEDIAKDKSVIIWHRFGKEKQYVVDALLKIGYGPDDMAFLDGSIPEKKRLEYRQDFQARRRRFMIANAQAGGIGVDMTAAEYMFFLTNDYNSSVRLQAEARMHRIGQANPCFIYDIVCKGTVDRKVIYALASKRNVSEYLWDLIERQGIDAAF